MCFYECIDVFFNSILKEFSLEDNEVELEWIDFYPVLAVLYWHTEQTHMENFSLHLMR